MIQLVPNIQILYSQLREQVQNQQPNYKNWYLSEKVIAGNTYLYLSCKIGTTLINTSLGRSTPELSQRWQAVIAQKSADSAGSESARLVRALEAAGAYTPSALEAKVLTLLHQTELFQRGAILIGTHAYAQYQNMLGILYPSTASSTARTKDMDILVRPAAITVVAPTLGETLQDPKHQARPVPQLNLKSPSTDFTFYNNQLTLQFLTPSGLSDAYQTKALLQLGVHATALPHLGYLMQQAVPTAIVCAAGIPATIPHPARFAVHKLALSTFPDRPPDKASKDIAQSLQLLEYFQQWDQPALDFALEQAAADPALWSSVRRGFDRARQYNKELIKAVLNAAPGALNLDKPVRAKSRRR